MRRLALPFGKFAVIAGAECEIYLDRNGRYCIWSELPQPGFQSGRDSTFEYWPADDEQLECVEYSTRGRYRGLDVWAIPNRVGTLVLYPNVGSSPGSATPGQAEEAGFDNQGRPSEWIKIVKPDDPDLDVVTTRTPIDPPWFKRGKKADS